MEEETMQTKDKVKIGSGPLAAVIMLGAILLAVLMVLAVIFRFVGRDRELEFPQSMRETKVVSGVESEVEPDSIVCASDSQVVVAISSDSRLDFVDGDSVIVIFNELELYGIVELFMDRTAVYVDLNKLEIHELARYTYLAKNDSLWSIMPLELPCLTIFMEPGRPWSQVWKVRPKE